MRKRHGAFGTTPNKQSRTRGPVLHDTEPLSLTYSNGETALVGERNGVKASASFVGDQRPEGCDILAHGTVKREVGYASRIVITLVVGIEGGCGKPRQLLRRAREKFGFRLYPVKDDDTGQETNVYTLAEVSVSAVDYLLSKRGTWIEFMEETNVRVAGNGSVEHVARKPKRKSSSYHPDYRRSEAGRAERHVYKEPMRVIG